MIICFSAKIYVSKLAAFGDVIGLRIYYCLRTGEAYSEVAQPVMYAAFLRVSSVERPSTWVTNMIPSDSSIMQKQQWH